VDLPPVDHLAAIAEHSAGLADAARCNLDTDVEHCPGWTVADLVAHLTEVHWQWASIAERRLQTPPPAEGRPERVGDDRLVETFEAGARRLVDVLRAADPADQVWTWAPAQQDVAFIVRHQVQEAAVHHWDAVHAAGGSLEIPGPVAADSVDEFLTFSVSSDADPADPARPPLDGSFVLACSDVAAAWLVGDGRGPGTVAVARSGPPPSAAGDTGAAVVTATASDLLLWLYGRVGLDAGLAPEDVLQRFRALCFTD